MVVLRVKAGSEKGKVYEVANENVVMGRDRAGAVQILDQGVSRKHAEIFQIGELYFIRDLESRNGTFVNADKITEVVLRFGDQIQIGNTTLVFEDRLARLREAIPEIGLGADVIVGFPGETETAFRETFDFIASSPLNYLHVFAWSARPGTPAARLPDRVHSAEIRQRSTRLRALGAKLSRDFRERFLGQELEAVILSLPENGRPGRALTGNFIELAFTAGGPAPGGLTKLRVDRVDRERTHATLTRRPVGRLRERASRSGVAPPIRGA